MWTDLGEDFCGRHGLWLTTLGIALGIGVALILTHVMSVFLFGVGSMDPVPYVSVSAALAALTPAAPSLPAHRSARVDPVVARGRNVAVPGSISMLRPEHR